MGSDRRDFLKLAGTGAVTAITGYTEPEGKRIGGDRSASTVGQDDDEFVFLVTQVFGTIDPAKQVDYTEGFAAQNLYDEFITVEAETNEPVEHVATNWEVEDDGTTWVFEIRDDIEFHDGGNLTAEDVVYSMNRMLSLERGYASFWLDELEPGEDIEARDEYTVAFDFDEPYGPFISTLVQFYTVDSETVRENEGEGDHGERGDYGEEYLSENVAGSGAYTLSGWDRGDNIRFEAFDNYWRGWPDTRFDRVRAQLIEEESTIKAMMRQGDADMTDQYMGTEAYQEMDGYDNVSVPEVPQLQLFHFPINTQIEPTDDINVRRAIAYAFDYETAVEQIIGGGQVAAGPVPREMAGHNDDLEPMEQDLDSAKEALDDAEYSVEEINEIGLEHVVVAGTELQRQMGLLNQSNLQELGIELDINPHQWSRITDRASREEATAHLTNIFHTAKIPSPDSHTYLMYHPSSFGTYISQSWYTTDEITQLLEEARNTVDFDERMEKYQEVQEHVVEGHPSVFVANPPYRIGLNDRVGGWQHRGVMAFDWDVNRMYPEQ